MNLLKGASEVGAPPVIDDGKVPFAKGLAEKGAIEIASSLMGGLE
jgi:hypothetical protein